MNQRSGRAAEKEFASLCAQKEITCNPASEDDHCEMNRPGNPGDPLV